MDFTSEELHEVKKRISETMADIDKERAALETFIGYMQTMSNASVKQITASASNSRKKRNRPPVEETIKDDEIQRLEDERNARQESITQLWLKLHELQQRERDLEGKPRIDGAF